MIECGGGITTSSADQLASTLQQLFSDQNKLNSKSKSSVDFVKDNKGATEKIMNYIEEKRLLTR